MVKSVLALITGITLLVLSAAGYVYLRFTSTEDAPAEAADTGIDACRAMVTAFESGELGADVDIDLAIIAGFKGSANADLSAAGEATERFRAMSEEEQMAALDDMLATLNQIASGCAAVGVPLPAEMLVPGSP